MRRRISEAIRKNTAQNNDGNPSLCPSDLRFIFCLLFFASSFPLCLYPHTVFLSSFFMSVTITRVHSHVRLRTNFLVCIETLGLAFM
mmetsp:Transcript_2883/g.5405  ORF Transcript_2883/g.5405 Transcript_2883/m.5405 type:complete len:87 (+) Transcript_2883:1975-2235(+)